MDRNFVPFDVIRPAIDVALRKESVDRNYIIKITKITPTAVALRKESVDRNAEDWLNAGSLSRSLSARRAWIEITPPKSVATLGAGRSPQGERG